MQYSGTVIQPCDSVKSVCERFTKILILYLFALYFDSLLLAKHNFHYHLHSYCSYSTGDNYLVLQLWFN